MAALLGIQHQMLQMPHNESAHTDTQLQAAASRRILCADGLGR
jgi:hypothetical protein